MAAAEEKVFTPLDIYLAGFLTLNGISPKLEIRNTRVVFSFEANDQLYGLLNLFNENTDVPVADFVTMVKSLRGKMLTVKESIGGNGKGQGNGYRKNF